MIQFDIFAQLPRSNLKKVNNDFELTRNWWKQLSPISELRELCLFAPMYLSKKRHKDISLIFSTWYGPKVQSPTFKHHQVYITSSAITVVELNFLLLSLSLNQSSKHAIWKSSFSVECLSSFWPVPNPTAPLMSWQLCPFKHTTPFTTIEGLSETLTAG